MMLTGSPYFPGGFAEYVAPASKFLQFEMGPAGRVASRGACGGGAEQGRLSAVGGGSYIGAELAGGGLGCPAGPGGGALA